jgi:uncharacterized membrane protein
MDARRNPVAPEAAARQREAARRTALGIGAVALAIYVAFLLRGILNA